MIKPRGMRWGGHVARMKKRNAYRILVENPEGKRSRGRPRRRWKNNIKMDLRQKGWGGTDWIDLAQDRDPWRDLVNTVMNLRVP
jgi:transcription termination factor 2